MNRPLLRLSPQELFQETHSYGEMACPNGSLCIRPTLPDCSHSAPHRRHFRPQHHHHFPNRLRPPDVFRGSSGLGFICFCSSFCRMCRFLSCGCSRSFRFAPALYFLSLASFSPSVTSPPTHHIPPRLQTRPAPPHPQNTPQDKNRFTGARLVRFTASEATTQTSKRKRSGNASKARESHGQGRLLPFPTVSAA